jgi:hypothetical protein
MITGIGPQAHQAVQKIEAVHARHFDIQRQHVGVQRLDHLARGDRIRRRADHFEIGCAIDDLGQQARASMPSRRRSEP